MVGDLVLRWLGLRVCLALGPLLSRCSAHFAVVGPPGPILAMVGEDAALPCRLSPKMSAEAMELMWERPSPRQVVYVYARGQEDTPAAEYRGRTVVFREDIAAGTASLRIRNVTASDGGTYLCHVQNGGFYAKAQLELQVAALGSEPLVEMQEFKAGGVRVTCTSAGWHPRPHIEWRDAQGRILPAVVVPEAADAQGLYVAAASVILEGGSGQGASCVIRNPLLGQEKSARVSIADSLLWTVYSWKVALGVSLVTQVLLLLGMGCCLRRQRRQIRALSQEKGWARAEEEAARAEKLQEELSKSQSESPPVLGSLDVTRHRLLPLFLAGWTKPGYRPPAVVLDVDTAQPAGPVPEDERSRQRAGGEKAEPAGQRGET